MRTKKSTLSMIVGTGLAIVMATTSSSTYGQGVLLEVDLTVANEITVRATTGLSLATISDSDTIGVYLDGFFANAPNAIAGSGDNGDFTSAQNIADVSPLDFRVAGDPGYNLWSWTNDPTADFVAGTVAFTGEFTATLTPDDYAEYLTAPNGGDLYFPADSADDVADATLIGRYIVMLPGSTGGAFVPPSAFTTFRGIALSAATSDFADSDDVRASFNPGFVLNDTEAPVWLIFDGNAPTATSFRVESQAGTPGLTYRVEAFNFNTNSFDPIGTQAEGFNTDAVVEFNIVAADHIDASGDVQGRVGWRQTGFTLNFPWEVRVDQVGWNQ